MNWFQFVFLREDSQESLRAWASHSRCELISICIFTWGFTSSTTIYSEITMLWIDFNLYFYVRIHKNYRIQIKARVVVNWFQFVFLREDSQATRFGQCGLRSCELISICIFTWGFTSQSIDSINKQLLWIDFNLYFYVRIHKCNHRNIS